MGGDGYVDKFPKDSDRELRREFRRSTIANALRVVIPFGIAVVGIIACHYWLNG